MTYAIAKNGSLNRFFGRNRVPVFSFPSETTNCAPFGAVLENPVGSAYGAEGGIEGGALA